MCLPEPTPPPFNPIQWQKLPYLERYRLLCKARAFQGDGAPISVYFVYIFTILFVYVGGWLLSCSITPGLGNLATYSSWWFMSIVFQRFVVFAAFFLFGLHSDVSVLSVRSSLLVAYLLGALVLVPLASNFFLPFVDQLRKFYSDRLVIGTLSRRSSPSGGCTFMAGRGSSWFSGLWANSTTTSGWTGSWSQASCWAETSEAATCTTLRYCEPSGNSPVFRRANFAAYPQSRNRSWASR